MSCANPNELLLASSLLLEEASHYLGEFDEYLDKYILSCRERVFIDRVAALLDKIDDYLDNTGESGPDPRQLTLPV